MHHLIVALLQLAVNVDVFDVQACQVLECFIWLPVVNEDLALLVDLGWHLLDFDLLLQVVESIGQLQIVGHVRHIYSVEFI